MPTKYIILDRDGVINHDSDQFIKSPEEWKPIPGSLEAIARLNQWGWRVILASNQSGVGRGLFGMDTLNAIHDKMVKSLAQVGGRLDAIFFCPHAADSTCECRKPKPGLLLQIAERFNVDLGGVHLPKDTRIMAMVAAANMDPEANEHPERLELTRAPNRHLSFGTGIHFCLGHQLARIEARCAIRALFERWPNLQLAVPEQQIRWRERPGLRAIAELPVVKGE